MYCLIIIFAISVKKNYRLHSVVMNIVSCTSGFENESSFTFLLEN